MDIPIVLGRASNFVQGLLLVALIGVCCVLMIVILLQRGRGGGLSGAFGGGGGSSAFGAKTGDVFTWITVVVAAVFLFLAVVSNYALDESEAPAPPPTTSAVTPVPGALDEDGQVIPTGVVPGQPGSQTITTKVPILVDEDGNIQSADGSSGITVEGKTTSPAAPSGEAPAEGEAKSEPAAEQDKTGSDSPNDSEGTP